ncbi:MAG: hypothetical protein ACFE8Z_04220 [Candidatus Hermodarchaeota archaeon]
MMATSGWGRVEHGSFMQSVYAERIETGQARPSYTSQFGQHLPGEEFGHIARKRDFERNPFYGWRHYMERLTQASVR